MQLFPVHVLILQLTMYEENQILFGRNIYFVYFYILFAWQILLICEY